MEHEYTTPTNPNPVVTPPPTTDAIETVLRSTAQNILTGVFGLLPLFFIPIAYAPFEYTKSLFVVFGVLLATIFFSLSILRSGRVSCIGGSALLAFWSVALVAVVAALLSGDMYDALLGDTFSVHSALFILLLVFTASLIALFGQNKLFIMRTYIALAASAVVLGAFHLIRAILGADTLTLGVFGANTSSPLGSWNDLALFFGLIILLSIVTLEQLPLTRSGRLLFSVVIGVSLAVLAMVNFFAVWLILALVSLMVLMYALTKDRLLARGRSFAEKPGVAVSSVMVSAAVFIVSLIFVVGGSVVGGAVSQVTGISYIEVRPSVSATIDIARDVYRDNAFVGIGPNRFSDAWRLYKDRSLNETIFWATDFTGGSGYIPTQFVTTGILGVLGWIAFFTLFLLTGFRMLFKTVLADRFWYFIGTSSFVAATYLWVMACVYTPGVTTLLLTALFTGVTFAAAAVLMKDRVYTWAIDDNRRAGFALVGLVMVMIILAVSSLYYIGRHYAAVYTVSGAVSGLDGSATLEAVEQKIVSAFGMVASDQFARQIAFYQLSKMNALIGETSPTAEEQQQFQLAAANGINAANQAIAIDTSDPLNQSALGGIYSLLAAAGVEGAADRARDAYSKARALDPQNPSYALLEAQLLARAGDRDGARGKIAEAISLKSNYTDALFFLSQLDVAEGNVDDAIVTTQAIISLEPNNPARLYQLGVLLSSDKQRDAAIAAFERAVVLDPNYANARYFLALGYIEVGNTSGALAQLEAIDALNPGNQQIQNLLGELRAGRTPQLQTSATGTPDPVVDANSGVTSDGDTVTTSEAPDTSLIAPVNPVSDDVTETAPGV